MKKQTHQSENLRIKALNLYDNEEEISKIASALSVKTRRDIIKLINTSGLTISEIAWKLNIPISTASFHVKTLIDAGLLIYSNASKKVGNEKKVFLGNYLFTLFTGNTQNQITVKNETQVFNIPIGSYTDYKVEPTCGIATKAGHLFVSDTPCVFSSPNRFEAGIIWIKSGYLEYSIPLLDFAFKQNEAVSYNDKKSIISLCFSFEICSECARYNHSFKSDITFFVNGVELCTYLSPGDFGERRGKLNPDWWPDSHTQYGLLQNLDIRFDGTYLNEKRVSDLGISDLGLLDNNLLKFKIAVKDDAKHVGGFNVFGKDFGDYNQDILLTVTYQKTLKQIEK